MSDRLTIAAMLLAATAQRREIKHDDILSSLIKADKMVAVDGDFVTVAVGVAAGESETVAVTILPTGLPTEYVGDFAFKVDDRCHCIDASTRVIVSSSTDGVKYRQGRGRPDQWIGGKYALFDRAGVMRNGEYVAILTSTPPAPEPEPPTVHVDGFAFQVGDVVVGEMCNRVILSTSPLTWILASTEAEPRVGVRNENDYPATGRFIRNEFAVWRGGELVREAVA